MKVLLIDNYDSFTYNLEHLLLRCGAEVTVARNDRITCSDIAGFSGVVFSPGPGLPDDAGIMKEAIRLYAHEKPMLGVCLGHQAIAEVFGGSLINTGKVWHGVESSIRVTDQDEYLFNGISSPFPAGRYHSWSVDPQHLPQCLKVTAVDNDGIIMALSHREFPVKGVQFHPESVMTGQGFLIIRNWVERLSSRAPLSKQKEATR